MLVIFLSITFVLSMLYGSIFYFFYSGWKKKKSEKIIDDQNKPTGVSIIIPARNEEQYIKNCIDSILANDYSKNLFEIIVINDDSSDRTAELVRSFEMENVRCVDLIAYTIPPHFGKAYKKWAIEIGVQLAKYDTIITTDADTVMKPTWLQSMVHYYQSSGAVLLSGPVLFIEEKTILSTFQRIDFMMMQGITAAVNQLNIGNMCNGANLMFSKAAFLAIDGFSNVTKQVSGDDYMLMSKMRQLYPKGIKYILNNDVVVMTYAPKTWKHFFQQRIRWASKSGKNKDKKIDIILLIVYLYNLTCLIFFILAFLNNKLLFICFILILVKVLIEYKLFKSVAYFFGVYIASLYFIILQPLHILYIFISSNLGFIAPFKWKGRIAK